MTTGQGIMRQIANHRETVLVAVLLALFVGFAVSTPGFFDAFNLLERTRYWVPIGLIAVPMTFIIATAGIDLSVASILALSSMVMGLLFRDAGWPIELAAIGAVGVGMAAGAVNGGVSSYLRVPPLVVSLATMTLFRGIAMGLSRARPVGGFPDGFQWLGQGALLRVPIGRDLVPIPFSFVVMLVVFAVGWVVMRKTWMGRFTELIGENQIAARFAGIDVDLVKFCIYTIAGALCGVAAIFHTAFYATAKADTAMGMELEIIACVVVGGTRISGGTGSISGTLLGLFIIGILQFGLEMAGVRSRNIIVVVGLVLILTVVVNEWLGKRALGEQT